MIPAADGDRMMSTRRQNETKTTHRVGCESGQEAFLDVFVSVQAEGRVHKRVVNVTHD